MKTRISIVVTLSFLLMACNNSCAFLDWNCNSSGKETYGYKTWGRCTDSQQEIAKSILADKYTQQVDSDILNKCLDSRNYKFESDPKYLEK